ncbi:MAG TPA: DUF5777 family beta-barrel protein [Flavisolibacter sp.]|nr:DUF5777 family beta-barrel protein [Flavisolibacter sp.]
MKQIISVLLFIAAGYPVAAQDSLDLLAGLTPQERYATAAFKSPRVIMSHSVEMLKPGVLDFRILHRFGNINQGMGEFFGLDQATIRLGLDYGLTQNLTIGIGRGNFKKELDGFVKYRPLQQLDGTGGFPFSLVLAAGSTINTSQWTGAAKQESFVNRQSFYSQLILGRKLSESLTLQLAPTLLHRNLVAANDPNQTYALGTGGRIRLSRRVSLNVDHYLVFNKNKSLQVYNPLSIGFDIETGGHVFQLHFTNAIGMNERAFLTETTNRWSKGDIQLGFNISRTFQLKSKNIH